MAECIPADHQKRTKRQEDPGACHHSDSATLGIKEERKDRLRNLNRFQVLVGENGDESNIKDSEKITLRLDMEEESLAAMAPIEKKNDRKKARMKSILFWRKKNDHKSSTIANSNGDNEGAGQHVDTACATPATNDLEGAASESHPRPKPLTTLEKWAAKQREKSDKKRIMQANRRQVPPKTLKTHLIPQQYEIKHKNSSWWNANRILRRRPKTKATCPDEQTAEEPQQLPETHEETPEADDAQDTTDPINDYEHTCAICYDIMVRPHEVRPCGHVFCELCLRQLQSTTASRQPLWYPRGVRNGREQRDILVLCPICRGSIEKCHAKGELDEVIRAKYPQRHEERQRLLHDETRKPRNSRLPSSRPGQYRQLHQNHRPNHRPGPVQNQRLPAGKKVGEILRTFGWILLLCAVGSVLALYFVSMIITVGLLKFCFACVGKGGLVFDKDRGDARSPISFLMMQVLSFATFLVAVKLFVTLYWGQLIVLYLVVLFLISMGYSLDGSAGATIFKVVMAAISFRPR